MDNTPLSPAEIAEIEARDAGYDECHAYENESWQDCADDRRALLAHLRALESRPSPVVAATTEEVEALDYAADLIDRWVNKDFGVAQRRVKLLRALASRAPSTREGEAVREFHTCPSCKNGFLKPFVCITCGAEKLYDSTVTSLQARVAALTDALEKARNKLNDWPYLNSRDYAESIRDDLDAAIGGEKAPRHPRRRG